MQPNFVKVEEFKTDNLISLHEVAVLYAEKKFKQKGGILPTWIISILGRAVWIETEWENNWDKDKVIYAISKLLNEFNCSTYSWISESWYAVLTEDKKDLQEIVDKHGVKALPPEYRDDIMAIHTHSRDGKFLTTRFKVTIRKRGPNFLGPRIDEDFKAPMQGRMSSLFR
jgi:hypothetical protein